MKIIIFIMSLMSNSVMAQPLGYRAECLKTMVEEEFSEPPPSRSELQMAVAAKALPENMIAPMFIDGKKSKYGWDARNQMVVLF
ncbi:hypothetical protein [Bdellovibrio bacteriovorus]|uniref:hypothetical protein n=1 Tax=Bdellovibrio bacteriovorus TaxID=959 RepID=UPI0035A5B674